MRPPLGNMMNRQSTRRTFLKSAAFATAGVAALSHRAFAQSQGANEKIVLGIIGAGGMGRGNLEEFLRLPGVEIGAVCDVDAKHAELGVAEALKRQSRRPAVYKDFRAVLDRKDIDAVVLSTPDHWHAIPLIAACEAGKDIYCEKPISHSLVEARAMAAAAKHFNRVVQVGTWQRSVPHFSQAVEFVRSGKMGNIHVCRAWALNGLTDIGHQTPVAPPPELDWNFWLGPAPARPYQPNRCHYSWRWFYDTGGGKLADWGVHMIDIVLLGMNESDPIAVHSEGGIYVADDDREAPDTLQTLYRFPRWQMLWEQRTGNVRGLDGGKEHGAEFIGEKGTLIVDRSAVRWFPKDEDSEDPGPGPTRRGPNTHWQNFIECIKTRAQPRADIASLAKTTMLCHLGNISWQAGTTVEWDATAQDVKNRRAVSKARAYERDYRKPWKLKHYRA